MSALLVFLLVLFVAGLAWMIGFIQGSRAQRRMDKGLSELRKDPV